jgi:hypothetical protein
MVHSIFVRAGCLSAGAVVSGNSNIYHRFDTGRALT